MAEKEAKARIKINRLLEDASWRFFDDENGSDTIVLEPRIDHPLREKYPANHRPRLGRGWC